MFDKLKKGNSSTAVPKIERTERTETPEDTGSPPAYLTKSAVQSYDIKYKDWKSTKGIVHDLSTGERTHQFDLPTLTRSKAIFRTLPDGTEIGRGQVNPFKKNLTVELRGQEIALLCKKALSADYLFESPALNGKTMEWKYFSGWSKLGFVLLDEQSLPVARWTLKGGTVFTNLGSLELMGTKADSQAAKEEILLTGGTLIYMMICSRSGLN